MKWRIYLGIGLSVWETAKTCGKWRRSVGNGSNMWGNDLIIWRIYLLKYLRIGLSVWETKPKYVGNDVDLWEMAQICGEMT